MDPIRRPIHHLHQQRGSHYDEASEQHDEDRRAVAGIGKAEVEATGFAARPHGEEILKQPSLAAGRTAAGQARDKGRWGLRVAHLNSLPPSNFSYRPYAGHRAWKAMRT